MCCTTLISSFARRLLITVTLSLMSLSALAALPDPVRGGKDGGPLDLLLLKGNIEIGFGKPIPVDETLTNKLEKLGYRITVVRDFQPLEADYLRQFNCVVWISPSPYAGSAYFNPASWRGGVHLRTVRRNAELLRRYVADGGGLLLNPSMEEVGMSRADAYQQLMAPYGLEPQCAQVRDEKHAYEHDKAIGQFPLHLCWTEAIARHPATEGVKRIYYADFLMRWDDNYTTMPLLPRDKAWTVLVKGMPGSVSAWKQGTLFERGFWQPAPGWNEPPICVAREYGKGRVAAIGIAHFHLFYFPYSQKRSYWENVFGKTDGLLMEKGDGETPSDVFRLMDNLYRWLSEPGVKEEFGGFDPEAGVQISEIPEAEPPNVSAVWAQEDPLCGGTVRPMKVLVGARTAASDGQGSVQQYAEAAKKTGYDVVCFTETYEKTNDQKYLRLVADCDRYSDQDVALLPGLEVADKYDNRFLLIGKRRPVRPHLRMQDGQSEPGRKVIWTGHFMLGMGDILPCASRPQQNAKLRPGQGHLPPDLYSHVSGFPIATYRGGKQVDDGMDCYRWQLYAASIPIPLAVHEVYAPSELERAAQTGLQCYMNSDTPAHAAYYFQQGLESYGGNPMRYYVSSGPLVDVCEVDNSRAAQWTVSLKARGEDPVTEVLVHDQRQLYRRFTPNAQKVDVRWSSDQSAHQIYLIELKDKAGGVAYLSGIRNVPRRYFFRCMDRQNWFGTTVDTTYTGRRRTMPGYAKAELPGVELNNQICPMLNFVYNGQGFVVVDWKQTHTLVPGDPTPGIDSYPIFNATPIPDYEAVVRYTMIPWPKTIFPTVRVTLKKNLTARGDVWPVIASVKPGSYYIYNDGAKRIEGSLPEEGFVDLPIGGVAGNILALTPLRVDARGNVGLKSPGDGKAVRAGTKYEGRFLRIGATEPKAIEAVRRSMGFGGTPPYRVQVKQGKLVKTEAWMYFQAQDYGVAGRIQGGQMPAWVGGGPGAVPIIMEGANPNWALGMWSSAQPQKIRQFNFLEGQAAGQISVTENQDFYFGNLLLAGDDHLKLAFTHPWTATAVGIEVQNPTDKPIETDVGTAPAIPDRLPVKAHVTVPAGGSVFLEYR